MTEATPQSVGGGERPVLRVLVADDEPLIGRALERLLTRRGHRVTAVGDAAAALQRLNDETWDIVLVDDHMPGDGRTVLLELAKRGFRGRVFLMSGALELIEETLPPGVEALPKPFSFDHLVALLETGGRRRP